MVGWDVLVLGRLGLWTPVAERRSGHPVGHFVTEDLGLCPFLVWSSREVCRAPHA